jgi:uncharacterized protein (TIGR02246 family)
MSEETRMADTAHSKPKPTFARIWRGRTTRAKADAYAAYLYEHGIKPLEEKALAVQQLREDRAQESEFVTISYWESVEAMSRFAGPDPRRIHHLERDKEFLIELPESVQVLQIASSKGLFPTLETRCMSDDERAIRELIDTWMTASKAGDTATVLRLMTDDVVFTVPGREPFGKQQFAAASRDMQGVRIEGTAEIRELRVMGDWAYLRNFLEMSITPPGGNTMQRSGYTLTLVRKEADGRWRLARDANMLTPKN